MSTLILALAAVTTPAAQCHKIHYREDGTVEESRISSDEASKIRDNSTSAHSHSSGPGSVSSSSSVSVSSRNGKTVSRSSAGAANEHRSVEMTNDETGCTIVVDDRPASGDEQ